VQQKTLDCSCLKTVVSLNLQCLDIFVTTETSQEAEPFQTTAALFSVDCSQL